MRKNNIQNEKGEVQRRSTILVTCLIVSLMICFFGFGYGAGGLNIANYASERFQLLNNAPSNYTVVNFDLNNCINNDFSGVTSITRSVLPSNMLGLGFTVKPDGKTVVVNARYDTMHPGKYTSEDIAANKVKYFENVNLTFGKKVEAIYGGLTAKNQIEGTVILFLLEDGTVEYLNYSNIYNSQQFIKKKLYRATNIIRFENITINDGTKDGYNTIIGYRSDGSYFDIGKLVEK